MVKLLIIADDFTGALDTGVQFAARGAATRVVTDLAYDFTLADAEVLVMVAETRHLPPEEAYDVVYRTARECPGGWYPLHIQKNGLSTAGQHRKRADGGHGCCRIGYHRLPTGLP